MDADVLISIRNLTRFYGKGHLAVRVLDIKDLQLKRGEFVAVTGPSGCGKTTLLNLLGTLERPSGGDIIFEGKNLSGRDENYLCRFRRDKIGFVFQSYNLIPTISALKNVMVPAFPLGGGYAGRARRLLAQVGLTGKENRRPEELSGGEQQRVAIARALILDPEVILADEPTGNLDSASGAEIIKLLERLNGQGKTVLVATHHRRVAEACGRKIRLYDGRVAEDSA